MARLLRIAVGLPGLAFVFNGVAWWVAPEFAGEQLGMPLLGGAGLSTQIADLASFFLTLGTCMLTGLMTGRGVWFFPAILLLGFAIFGRLVAWLFHGADLTVEMIAVEAIVIALLLATSRAMERTANVNGLG
jgi:hypothetical protein